MAHSVTYVYQTGHNPAVPGGRAGSTREDKPGEKTMLEDCNRKKDKQKNQVKIKTNRSQLNGANSVSLVSSTTPAGNMTPETWYNSSKEMSLRCTVILEDESLWASLAAACSTAE